MQKMWGPRATWVSAVSCGEGVEMLEVDTVIQKTVMRQLVLEPLPNESEVDCSNDPGKVVKIAH